jgi:hypothetical protein
MVNKSDYLKVNSFADINYKKILSDYYHHFHGRAVEIKTTLKAFKVF